jgi:hypothetical protein
MASSLLFESTTRAPRPCCKLPCTMNVSPDNPSVPSSILALAPTTRQCHCRSPPCSQQFCRCHSSPSPAPSVSIVAPKEIIPGSSCCLVPTPRGLLESPYETVGRLVVVVPLMSVTTHALRVSRPESAMVDCPTSRRQPSKIMLIWSISISTRQRDGPLHYGHHCGENFPRGSL